MKKWLNGWSKTSQAIALICVGLAAATVLATVEPETDALRLFGRWRSRGGFRYTPVQAEKHSAEMHTTTQPQPVQQQPIEDITVPVDKPVEVDPASLDSTEGITVAMAPYVPADYVERYTDGQEDAEKALEDARKQLNKARKEMKKAAEKAGVEWPVKKPAQKEEVMSAASDNIPATTESREPAKGTATLDNISVYAVEQELVAYANSVRIKHGLAPLIVNQPLMDSARKHATWMCSHGMVHGNSNGVWNGEIIAAGQPTARDAINAWLNSPPHRAHLLGRHHRYVGLTGYTRGGQVYWCGQFK